MTPSPIINDEAKQKLAKIKHESFTLKYLPSEVQAPSENLICSNCPSSMWFTSGTDMKAFCKVMHAIVWSTKDQTKRILCDGNTPEEDSMPKNENPQEESSSLEVSPEAEPDLEAFITDEVNKL